MNVSHGLL